MENWNWDLILKLASSISGIVALIGLIYQISKDLSSKKPKYKLEVESFEEFSFIFNSAFQTVTVRNVGNRPMYIKSVGIIFNDKKYECESIKQLTKKIEKGHINPDIESTNFDDEIIDFKNAIDQSEHMVQPNSMISFNYEMNPLIIINDPLFITVKDVENNIYVSKNYIDREIYYSIIENNHLNDK